MVGQRKGLGLPGGPWYVVRKDVGENVLYVSHHAELAGHQRSSFRVPELHWIGSPPVGERLQVRIRHSPTLLWGEISTLDGGGLEIRLETEDPGIAPGQWAVLYDGDECLGGGMIAI